MKLKELNCLSKHRENVRNSQPCISMNLCTKFSKAQVLPCEYREVTVKPKPILVVKTTGFKNLLVSDKDFHGLSKICRPTANLLLRSAILCRFSIL